jgi:uncharacterized membrane protein
VKIIFLSKQRIHHFKTIVYLSMFALMLVLLRYFLPGHKSLFFLLYNLFLALIPLVVSTYIRFYLQGNIYKIKLLMFCLLWLVFFPNAPYLLTDGLHVMGNDFTMILLDIVIWIYITCIAIWIAMLSLMDIELMLFQTTMNKLLIHCCIILIVVLSAYGIYLGRDLRLNSWDVLRKPFLLLDYIRQTFTNQTPGFFNWKAVFFYSSILYIGYIVFKLMNRKG